MDYLVNVTGLDVLQSRLNGTAEKLTIVLQRRINQASLELQGRIVDGLAGGIYGIQSRHGMSGLAGSVRVIPAVIEGEVVAGGVKGAGGPEWYGIVHEMGGLSAYDIVAKNAKALAWQAYGNFPSNAKQGKLGFTADMIFRKRVVHPPAKRRRWMGQPTDEMRPRIREIVAGSLQTELGFSA